MSQFDYDLFVIGGGSGGFAARASQRRSAKRWRSPKSIASAGPA